MWLSLFLSSKSWCCRVFVPFSFVSILKISGPDLKFDSDLLYPIKNGSPVFSIFERELCGPSIMSGSGGMV